MHGCIVTILASGKCAAKRMDMIGEFSIIKKKNTFLRAISSAKPLSSTITDHIYWQRLRRAKTLNWGEIAGEEGDQQEKMERYIAMGLGSTPATAQYNVFIGRLISGCRARGYGRWRMATCQVPSTCLIPLLFSPFIWDFRVSTGPHSNPTRYPTNEVVASDLEEKGGWPAAAVVSGSLHVILKSRSWELLITFKCFLKIYRLYTDGLLFRERPEEQHSTGACPIWR